MHKNCIDLYNIYTIVFLNLSILRMSCLSSIHFTHKITHLYMHLLQLFSHFYGKMTKATGYNTCSFKLYYLQS